MTNKYFKTLLGLACASSLMIACLNSENNATNTTPTPTDTSSKESNALIELNAKSDSETVDAIKGQLPESMKEVLENSTSRSYLENFVHFASVRTNPKQKIEGVNILQQVHVARDRSETSFLAIDILFDKEQKIETFTGIGNKGLYANLKKEEINHLKELEIDSVCSADSCSKGLIVIKQKIYEKDPIAISQGARQILFYDSKEFATYELSVDGKHLRLNKVPTVSLAYNLRENQLKREVLANSIKFKELTGYNIFCGAGFSDANDSDCNLSLLKLLNDSNLDKIKGFDFSTIQLVKSRQGSKNSIYQTVNSDFVVFDSAQSADQISVFLQKNVNRSDSDAAALRKIKIAKFNELEDEVHKVTKGVLSLVPMQSDLDLMIEAATKLTLVSEQLQKNLNFDSLKQKEYSFSVFLDHSFNFKRSQSSIAKPKEFWMTIDSNSTTNVIYQFIHGRIQQQSN